ncbi:hypothetical protein [Paenibacillus sp.]|uniref:hypothetical protein n=1 Tax=Paenibacillus sp. TaxID=58172 RepID=UPI00356A99D1
MNLGGSIVVFTQEILAQLFFHNPEGYSYLRLCFSYVSKEQIVRGVNILADAYFAYANKSAS